MRHGRWGHGGGVHLGAPAVGWRGVMVDGAASWGRDGRRGGGGSSGGTVTPQRLVDAGPNLVRDCWRAGSWRRSAAAAAHGALVRTACRSRPRILPDRSRRGAAGDRCCRAQGPRALLEVTSLQGGDPGRGRGRRGRAWGPVLGPVPWGRAGVPVAGRAGRRWCSGRNPCAVPGVAVSRFAVAGASPACLCVW